MLNLKRRLIGKGNHLFSAWEEAQQAEAEVAKGMRGLLANPGVRPLDRRERTRIRAYARDRFGSAGYAPWLEFYTVFRGQFHDGWVPANFFRNIAIRRINGKHADIGDSRSLMTRLLGGTPLLPDCAHFVGGEWRDIAGAPIRRDDVPSLLFAEGPEICVKLESTRRGRGVSFAHRDGFDLGALERQGDLVVQSVIRQHPLFDEVSPSAVATLRVMTGKLPGQPPFRVGAYFRCSLGEGRAVTAHALRIAVLDDDGTLAEFGSDETWRRFTAHPETGAPVGGRQLPQFREMVASCLSLHERLPQLGIIGWDVTLDAAGAVRVMELNTGQPDIKFIEMSQGPTLGAFEVERYVPGRRQAAGSARPAA